MDTQGNPLLSWPCYCQGKRMEELTQTLLLTTLDLETTRVRAQEELKMRDEQLTLLRDMLNKVIRERDEAQDKCQTLFFEKLLLQQKQEGQQISSIEDEPRRGLDSNNGFSSSDCEESIVSSMVMDPIPSSLVTEKPLPEMGKLLEAVMKAGPLLQTLLLAGPLPEWRHPPPPLESYQIPPPPLVIPPPPPGHLHHQDSLLKVTAFNNNYISNCGGIKRKRGICEGSDSSGDSKYQRIVLN